MGKSNSGVGSAFGIAVMERSLTNSVRRLWEGDLSPRDLPRIEKALRAIITSNALVVSKADLELNPESNPETSEAFEGALQHEFLPPADRHPSARDHMSERESSFLIESVKAAMPKLVAQFGVAVPNDKDWHSDEEVEEADEIGDIYNAARDWVLGEADHFEYDSNPAGTSFTIDALQSHIEQSASYLIGCHRAGMLVYGASPVSLVCESHVFSKWPDELFRHFDKEHQELVRELRGPGIGIDLPPLTNLVLGRAERRSDLEQVIAELREEYATSRRDLWKTLQEMWLAEDLRTQCKILRELVAASNSLFAAAFPERFDALSLGIDAASLSVGGVLRQFRTHDSPNARVAAISFVEKLASDFSKGLLNQRTVLRRHLSEAERREFAID